MKYRKTLIILILIIAALLMAGCEKTVTEYVEHSWKEVEGFTYSEKIILNGYVTNCNDFYIATYPEFMEYSNEVDNFITNYRYYNAPLDVKYKPIISNNLLVYTTRERDKFMLRRIDKGEVPDPYTYSLLRIEFDQIAGAENFDLELCMDFWTEDLGAANDNYIFTILDDINDKGQFICIIEYELADFDPENGETDGLIINDIVFERFTEPSPPNRINAMHILDDRILLSCNGNHIVQSNGILRAIDRSELPYAISDIFSYDNVLYAQDNAGDVYISNDAGESWEYKNSINLHPVYYVINDNIIGVYGYQLFNIDFENEIITELDNDGLYGMGISSLNLFNDMVYVTTLHGLLYKPMDDFFTIKSN